jgi:three-Cys-motif partner protein
MTVKHYDWKVGTPPPELGPHSVAKHKILRAYILKYLEIVTATSAQTELNITFIDGYAGGGQYRLGSDLLPGSPLILLEAVAEAEAKLAATRAKGFRINAQFVFIDEKRHHTEFLLEQIKASPFKELLGKSIQVWTADFNERVDDLVQ